MLYFGWIPNVRGRLSFKSIGTSTKPYPIKRLFADDYMIIYQDRTLNDSALPRRLRVFLFEWKFSPIRKLVDTLVRRGVLNSSGCMAKLVYNSGEFKFVYFENIDEGPDDCLVGRVYAVLNDKRVINSFDINRYLENLEGLGRSEIERTLERESVIHAEFRLHRDGIVEFSSPEFAKIDERHWTNDKKYKDFERDAVSQLYYFLKDLCHQHQHHNPKTDALLPLVAAGSACQDATLELLGEESLKSLYRSVLSKRRARAESEFYSMKGILSYINSFRRVIISRNPKSSIKKFCYEGDKSILESISARSDYVAMSVGNKRRMLSSVPIIGSLTVSVTALVFAFSSLLILIEKSSTEIPTNRVDIIEVPDWYFTLISKIVSNPLVILLSIFSLLFGVYLYRENKIANTKLSRDIKRILFGAAKASFFAIGASLLIASFGIIIASLRNIYYL